MTLPTSRYIEQKLTDPIHPLATGSRTLYYLKMHGSHNWLSSDGSRRMVIGPDKEEQINREPLLKWYKEIFKMLLGRRGVKPLVIGYGFGDEHINSMIADAINNNGLELFVICPEQRVDFVKNLSKCTDGKTLRSGLTKYFSGNLFKIFPGNQRTTADFQDICRELFA